MSCNKMNQLGIFHFTDVLDSNVPTTGIILDRHNMNLQTLLLDSNLPSTESMYNEKNENQILINEEENEENMNQAPMQVIVGACS